MGRNHTSNEELDTSRCVCEGAVNAHEQFTARRPLATQHGAPQTEIESELLQIWEEVLAVRGVGINDNFFELGGDSLFAIKIIARLRDAKSIELPISLVFEHPTVARLAAQIEISSLPLSVLSEVAVCTGGSEAKSLLSFAQQRLWFLDQLQAGTPAYNISCGFWLRGPLIVSAMESSLREIVRRHEVLRARFVGYDGKPEQVVMEVTDLRLEIVDLQAISEEAQHFQIERLTKEEAQRPFDLSEDLLLRARLYCLGNQTNLLTCTQHHIVSDAWSLNVFWKELAILYDANLAGTPSPLPELPLQYADYSVWQRERLHGSALNRLLDYWKNQLTDAPALLELPIDFPRPAVQSHQGARQNFVIGLELTQTLQKLCRQQDVTLFMTLLAAWQVLLARYSGQEDVVVGVPVAGRNQTELEDLIGFFANTLPLRTNLSGNPPFVDLLKQVRATTLEGFAHQELPFEKLVEELHPDRNLSHSPLFQVMFVLQNKPRLPPKLKGLDIAPFDVPRVTAKFDLSLSMVEYPDGLQGTISYNTDLFTAETISRLLNSFQTLLQGIAVDPLCRIGELPLLPPDERDLLLVKWNQTSTGPMYETCIHELVELQVERTPNAPAVRFQGEELTYQELNDRSNQLAHYLIGIGVGPESLVGVCMERSLDLVIALLGVLKAGGAYLPLDPVYPKDRLSFMLKDAAVRVLLTQKKLLPFLPNHDAHLVSIDSDRHVIVRESIQDPTRTATPDNLAYVIYTSGSTGEPKGVMICHRGVCNYLNWRHNYFPLSVNDRLLQTASISFDDSVWQIFEPLTCGAVLVLVESGGEQDMAALIRLIHRDGITAANFVPSILRAFLEETGVETCRSLRRITTGGETLSVELQNRVFELLPAKLYNGYGPTEATIGSTFWTCQRCSDLANVPIGRPIANVEVFVLDQFLQPIPISVPGELYIGGIGLARGYLNRPELTDQKFIPHPFNGKDGSRIYKTGDRVRWSNDGNLEFLGRLDQQVKLRGFRIELGEIEAALNMYSNVEVSVVVLREQGSSEKQLVAYVVPRHDAPELSVVELRGFLWQKLPGYMIPSAIVVLKELPLTPNGKIDRQALPAPHAVAFSRISRSGEAALQNSDEKLLVAIWAKLLNHQNLGIHDNFFELGGHSLLATRMIALVRSELRGVELTLRDLFEAPTIAGILAQSQRRAIERAGNERSTIHIPDADGVGRIIPPPQTCNSANSHHHTAGRVIDPTNYVEIIRAGAENMPPVICIGDTRPIPLMLSLLPAEVPLLLLKLDGVQVRPPAYMTIDQVADVYHRALQKHCGQRRAVVVGFSFGGLLAYRLATELSQNGWTEIRTVLIEPTMPKRYWPVAVRMQNGIRTIRKWLGLTRRGLLQGLLPARIDHQNKGETEDLKAYWENMLPHYSEIVRTARLSPQHQRLVLAGTMQYHAHFALSWAKICGGDMVPCIHPPSDGHFSCFQPANSKDWIASLEMLYGDISSRDGSLQG